MKSDKVQILMTASSPVLLEKGKAAVAANLMKNGNFDVNTHSKFTLPVSQFSNEKKVDAVRTRLPCGMKELITAMTEHTTVTESELIRQLLSIGIDVVLAGLPEETRNQILSQQ